MLVRHAVVESECSADLLRQFRLDFLRVTVLHVQAALRAYDEEPGRPVGLRMAQIHRRIGEHLAHSSDNDLR